MELGGVGSSSGRGRKHIYHVLIMNLHSCAVDVNIPIFQDVHNLKRAGNWLSESRKEAPGREFKFVWRQRPWVVPRSWCLGADTAGRWGLRIRKGGHTWNTGFLVHMESITSHCELESLGVLVISSAASMVTHGPQEPNWAPASEPGAHVHR